MDRLVDITLLLHLVSAKFYQGFYAISAEVLLNGDNCYIFGLFAKLLGVLETSGCLTSDKFSLEEITLFVLEVRARHRDAERNAGD